MSRPVPLYRQENVLIHNRIQRYQAVPLPAEEENTFNVSTAKKSRVVPQSICSACGTRMPKQQARICPFCEAELCPTCYHNTQERIEAESEGDE
ncbi:MAG TPA: hypothetical protein PLG09_08445 [Syntrophomonadaceae bacterium]|jgi:predicted sulfurtransferase|nr:hypothetical protein [Syntrophomonadaceae bacterium]HOQ10136.1 hypothetical protein [Syntrophomonadaceae bacterium]HPU49269.1 hypothetical protein [Syntrophomonadaceae bacterium]